MTEDIKFLILDMDGVLWRGETPMPGLAQFFEDIRAAGIEAILATNNASKTVEQYQQKLARFGVDMPAERILTSAEATGDYLAESYPPGTAVYVVGGPGLHEAMTSRGFEVVTPRQAREGRAAELVVIGFSPQATYDDLAMAAHLVHKGARFVGTNPDVTFPSEVGPMPGAGALLALVSTATGVEPTIVGKPKPIMFEQALHRLNADKRDTAMVGDRLATDIAGARELGLQTILVLSGISTREEAANGPVEPDLILTDIGALADYLANNNA